MLVGDGLYTTGSSRMGFGEVLSWINVWNNLYINISHGIFETKKKEYEYYLMFGGCSFSIKWNRGMDEYYLDPQLYFRLQYC